MKNVLVALILCIYTSKGFSGAADYKAPDDQGAGAKPAATAPAAAKPKPATTSASKEAPKGPYKGTCLFGGWPSSYDDGCNSPAKLAEYKTLKNRVENKSLCTGEDKFLCNPVVFGTTCVALSPASTLTKRCEETSRKLYYNSGVQGMAKDFMKDFASMEGDELFVGTSVALSELCKSDSDYIKHLKAKGGASEGLVKDCETHGNKLEEIRRHIGLNNTAADAGELLKALNSGSLPAAMTKGACEFEQIDTAKYGELLKKYDSQCKPKQFSDPLYSSSTEAANAQSLYTAFSQIAASGCIDSVNGDSATDSSGKKTNICSIDVSSLYKSSDTFGSLETLQSSFKADFKGKYSGSMDLSLGDFGKTALSAHAWKEKIYEKNPELAKACGWGKEEEDANKAKADAILANDKNKINYNPYDCADVEGSYQLREEGKDPRCLDPSNSLDAKIIESWDQKRLADKKPADDKDKKEDPYIEGTEMKKDAIASLDENGDGVISPEESYSAYANEGINKGAGLEQADLDKANKYLAEQKKAAVEKLAKVDSYLEGTKIKKEHIAALDTDKNGVISPEEGAMAYADPNFGEYLEQTDIDKANQYLADQKKASEEIASEDSKPASASTPADLDQYEASKPKQLPSSEYQDLVKELEGKKVVATDGIYEWTDADGTKNRLDGSRILETFKPVRAPAAQAAGITQKAAAPSSNGQDFTTVSKAANKDNIAKFESDKVTISSNEIAVTRDPTAYKSDRYDVADSDIPKVEELFKAQGAKPHGDSILNTDGAMIYWLNGKPKILKTTFLPNRQEEVSLNIHSLPDSKIENGSLNIGGDTTFKANSVNNYGHLIFDKNQAALMKSRFSQYQNYEKANIFHISGVGSLQYRPDGTAVFVPTPEKFKK